MLSALALSSTVPAARAAWTDSITWKVTAESAFSDGDHNPFWFQTNRQGLVSPRTDSGFVEIGAVREPEHDRRFSWGAGVDIAVPWRGQSPWVIQQLYGEIRYRCLNLMVGAKEMWGEFNNPWLSSGNLMYSGNARPVPQARIGIFDYADIWGTDGWLGVKGYIAYGKYTDDAWQRDWVEPDTKYTKGVLFHSKGIWIRNGNPEKFPLVLECGLEMATQFGGTSYNAEYPGSVYHSPTTLKDWVKAFIPYPGNSDTLVGEQTNVQGNMTGAWQFCLSWQDPSGWGVKGYYEHYFEDHSMLFIEYPWKDGLFGIEGRLPDNPFVTSVVYEFIYSKDQSGPVLWDKNDDIPEQVSGVDGYYNHYIYDGWSHWGMGMGNPLALSPVYNNPHDIRFLSTRLKGHHFGISGDPAPGWKWRVMFSTTRNWGTYITPLREVMDAYSGLAEVSWRPPRLKGWEGTLGVAMDRGSYIGNSTGVMIRISKSGVFGR